MATLQVSVSTSERNDVENLAVHNKGLVQQKHYDRLHSISTRNRKQVLFTMLPYYGGKAGGKQGRYSKRVRKATAEGLNITSIGGQCKIPELSCKGCCKNESNNCSHRIKICYCDYQYTLYSDCCVDYLEYCRKTPQMAYEINKQEMSCIKPQYVRLRTVYRIWMVNKRPKSRKIDEISRNCEIDENQQLKVSNLRNFVPVFGESNLLFRNEFCARCNGIEKFEHFNEEIQCDVVPLPSMSITKLNDFVSKYCKIQIFTKSGQVIRQCYQADLCLPMRSGRCNQTLAYECSTKEYLCLEEIPWKERFKLCLSSIKSVSLKNDHNQNLGPPQEGPPLHIVFDVSDGNFVRHVKSASCPFAGELYDPYLEICRLTQVIPPVKENLDSYDVAVWFDCGRIHLPSLNQTIFSLTRHFNLERSQVSDLEYLLLEDTTKSRSEAIRFKLQLTNEQTFRLAKTNSTDDVMSGFERNLTNCTNCLSLRRLLFFSEKFNLTLWSFLLTFRSLPLTFGVCH